MKYYKILFFAKIYREKLFFTLHYSKTNFGEKKHKNRATYVFFLKNLQKKMCLYNKQPFHLDITLSEHHDKDISYKTYRSKQTEEKKRLENATCILLDRQIFLCERCKLMAGFEILFLFFVTCFQSVKEILSLVLVIDRLSFSTSHVREYTVRLKSRTQSSMILLFSNLWAYY